MNVLKLTKVGEHQMEGGLYKDKDGNFYVDCHFEPKPEGESVVYRLSPPKEIDGEPDREIHANIVILNPPSEREKREKVFAFDYMMLSRAQMDCNYYNSAEQFNRAHACTIEEMIADMKERWQKFPDDLKPKWCTWEQILEYEKKFCPN